MSYHILLIDDDDDFREEICEYLEEYEVIEASNGEKALKILTQPNEIDLVILDVRMPGIRGIELLREIKKMAPDLGVVICTGYSTKEVAVEALKGHADDYLEKPDDIHKIDEIVSKLLEAGKGGGNIDIGGIRGKIERVKYFVERNYDKKVTLEDAAAAVFLSPKYLSRVFKNTSGESFSEYRLGIKMEKARELLQRTGYNIAEISYKLGYQNTESFIRQFRKITGLTPGQYRKKVELEGSGLRELCE